VLGYLSFCVCMQCWVGVPNHQVYRAELANIFVRSLRSHLEAYGLTAAEVPLLDY